MKNDDKGNIPAGPPPIIGDFDGETLVQASTSLMTLLRAVVPTAEDATNVLTAMLTEVALLHEIPEELLLENVRFFMKLPLDGSGTCGECDACRANAAAKARRAANTH